MTASDVITAPLSMRLFGSMQVLVHGQPLPRLRSQKALWLLALLALRSDAPVQREWLAGTLWPDSEQSRAFGNLRVVLSELRRGLGREGERVQANARTVLLDLTHAEVDVFQFDSAVKSKSLAALEKAVALYRGPLLEGCGEEWAPHERRIREQNCLQALQLLAEAALAAQSPATAAAYYQQSVRIDPWFESAQRGWMEALAEAGDRNGALRVYRDFLNVLRSDPAAVPDPLTSALYARLKAEMRGTAEPAAKSAAKRAAPPVVSGNLPHPLTALIGREDEVTDVAVALRRSRLVVLTGIGGIGKTRLAIQTAAELQWEFADGVWMVALEALSESRAVVSRIASVFGVKEEVGHPLLQSITQHLRTKQLLLVLDNCEHVLQAAASLAGHLLAECGSLRILATSRETLGITGEVTWAVPSLAFPDIKHLPQSRATLLRVLMSYESVQLFVERAQAVQQSFALNATNAVEVGRVCAQLEGIPLAIELAASRTRVMSVEQLATRLQSHFGLLVGGSRVVMSRQQTLRQTLDWSYDLLNAPERVLFRRLAVFAGGGSLEAIEAACSGDGVNSSDILDLLTSLVSKSLVLFADSEPGVGGRYRLLVMVRQYAEEQLQTSGEVPNVKARLRRWLMALAEEADEHLYAPDQEEWLGRLEAEHDNVREALAWDTNDEEEAETTLRLAGALWRFWEIRGYATEGRQYLMRALEREKVQEGTAKYAKALTGAAALAYRQGDYSEARELHGKSLSIFRKSGNRRGMAASLANEGTVAWSQGDIATARVLLEESLGIHREMDNIVGTAETLNSLGNLVQSQGDYAAARALHEESLGLRRRSGDQRGIAFSLENLGNLALLHGRYQEAKSYFEESLDIRTRLGDKYGLMLSLGNLGMVAKAQGQYETSRSLIEECLLVSRELGDRQSIAMALGHLGILAKEQSDYSLAQARLEECLKLMRELGDQEGIAFALEHLGNVANDCGDAVSARGLLRESLAIRYSMGNKQGVSNTLFVLSAVHLAQADALRAVQLWAVCHALREKLGAPVPLNERPLYERRIEQARAQLGYAAFEAAWQAACAMDWEQTVVHSLKEE